MTTNEVEQELNFAEQPNQDLLCPVTLEFLLEPHQTDCCGHHISEKAVQMISKDGKSCPMCNNKDFSTHPDKYFKRNTINKLKVHCPHKKSGCDWAGDLGDMRRHSIACPKRPWKCQYCDFETIHEIGANDHTPKCPNYPLSCPNQCEIGTIPRHDAERHLLDCPLQLVECEFAGTGCEVKVHRRDLVRHMTESAQHHLMSATLLNLQLTRELHQKMEEKDKQIAELQQQIGNLDTKLQDLHTKAEQQGRNIDTKLAKLDAKAQQQGRNIDKKFLTLETKVEQHIEKQGGEITTKITNLKATMEANQLKIKNDLVLLNGFICQEFTLTEFKKYRDQGARGHWTSPKFTVSGGYQFDMHVWPAFGTQGTHMRVYIYKRHDKNKTEGVFIVQLLNQLGHHNHFSGVETKFTKADILKEVAKSCNFFPLDQLGYCADTNTQYLKDDCLKFRLFIKVSTD